MKVVQIVMSQRESTTAFSFFTTAAFLFFVATLFLFCLEILLPGNPSAKCHVRL
jgi:hypothetical protein